MGCNCHKNIDGKEVARQLSTMLNVPVNPPQTTTPSESDSADVADIHVMDDEPVYEPVYEMYTPAPVNESEITDDTVEIEPTVEFTANTVSETRDIENEGLETGLKRCYLCTKKHLAKAQEFHTEMHTGYPAHIRSLIFSMRVAEDGIREAFILWQKAMAQLNMAEGELIGFGESVNYEHKQLANDIRNCRLALSDDPNYTPNFEGLLLRVHTLQLRIIQ